MFSYSWDAAKGVVTDSGLRGSLASLPGNRPYVTVFALFRDQRNYDSQRRDNLVLLGHTNRSVRLSHKSQCEIALFWTLSRLIPDYCQGEAGKTLLTGFSGRLGLFGLLGLLGLQ